MGIAVFLSAIFLFSSCTKTADGNLTKDQLENKDLEAVSVEEKDFTESDEDLTSVDYKEFYEQLSPYGEWVQVKPEEIGMKQQTSSIDTKNDKGISLLSLIGVQDANASNFENSAMVYVWKPSPSLAINTVEGLTPEYAPYSNGRWVNTDKGWYFKANTPAEETTSHYGRWVNTPSAGWLWVPGRVWAPAWVDWKQNESQVSWAPLPPSAYMVNGSLSAPVIDNNSYVVVEKKYFLEPNVYKYNNTYTQSGERIVVSDMASVIGLVLVDNLLFNRGPDVSMIQTVYGRNIELVNITPVRTYSEIKYTDKQFYIYHPGFKRYKNKGNGNKWLNVNEPKQFKKYGEWENRSGKNEYKSEEKELKNEQKELRKDEKEIRKEIKKGDDGNMYNGNDNGKKNEGKVNGKKNNDNGNKHDGNDNKQKGNDKKQKGSDDNNKNDNNKKGKK